MIQSMEILQLPILALQERIEQEIEENPVLDLREDDPDLPAETHEAERRRAARRAFRGRARAGDQRDGPQRGGLRAADEDGRGVARPLRGALPSLAGRDGRGRRAEARRHGQHGRPAADAARLPPRPVGLVRDRAGRCGRCASGSSTISTPTATCKAAWRTCWAWRPRRTTWPWPQQALAVVQRLDPPGVAARDTARMPAFAAHARTCRYYEQLQTLITNAPGRPGAQPAAGHQPPHRLLDRIDPAGARRVAEAEAPSRAPSSTTPRSRPSRPTSSSNWARTASITSAWKTAARPASSSALITASCSPAGRSTTRRASTSSGRSIRPNG